ncbi:hypothetical protein Agub_g12764 [Astrephomene gubernaculifera]|uniref:Uncharacterized protein n=1 Tax=Astrephomene gubernaculifera TaxID=47775 RepID=A0AAD3E0P2_9CHLO|nr:hypothetical protein Agub_g12764 [Astrephomene gubernaculifera]
MTEVGFNKLSTEDLPFTVRIGSTGAGFGVGCGFGIGFGKPLNLGSVPALGQAAAGVSSGLSQFSQLFGGLGSGARDAVQGLGVKGLDAGLGCGVGVGYGFGAGLFLKPSAAEKLMRLLDSTVGHVARQVQARLSTAGVLLPPPYPHPPPTTHPAYSSPQPPLLSPQPPPATSYSATPLAPSGSTVGPPAALAQDHPQHHHLPLQQQHQHQHQQHHPQHQHQPESPWPPASPLSPHCAPPAAAPAPSQPQQPPPLHRRHGAHPGRPPAPAAAAACSPAEAASEGAVAGGSGGGSGGGGGDVAAARSGAGWQAGSSEELRALLRHERQLARLRARNRALRQAVCSLDRRLPVCQEPSDSWGDSDG